MIRDEVREQIARWLHYRYSQGKNRPLINGFYRREWEFAKSETVRLYHGLADSLILATPALANLLRLAERAEQEGFEVAVVDNEAELPEYHHNNFMLLGDKGRRQWEYFIVVARKVQQRMVMEGWRKVVGKLEQGGSHEASSNLNKG